MKRRQLIALISGTAVAWSLLVQAQPAMPFGSFATDALGAPLRTMAAVPRKPT